MKETKQIKIAIADDQTLLRDCLTKMVNSFENCKVIQEVSCGMELLDSIRKTQPPDIVLLDLCMPGMDGFETAKVLQKIYPNIKVLVVTMFDCEKTLITLLQAGVKGFVKKSVSSDDLKYAINHVMKTGYYFSDHSDAKMANILKNAKDGDILKSMLTEVEISFIKFACCTELTYKKIAEKMKIGQRSVDSIRDQLFIKLGIRTRIGLAIFAARNGFMDM